MRRRRAAVQWLPHVQHETQALAAQGWWSGTTSIPPTLGTQTTTVLSLVPDYPAAAVRAAGALPTLADFDGSAYRLRRIVGKFHCCVEQIVGGAAPLDRAIAGIFCLGFIVLRVDPLTGAPLDATVADYSPLALEATQDPWIWRRTWIMQNDFANVVPATQDTYQFPRAVYEYGSMQDGGHIDAKTARRISDEERLFAILSVANIELAAASIGTLARFVLDYRILASPLKTSGNRRNASR